MALKQNDSKHYYNQQNDTHHHNTQKNDSQDNDFQKDKLVKHYNYLHTNLYHMLSVIMLVVIMLSESQGLVRIDIEQNKGIKNNFTFKIQFANS